MITGRFASLVFTNRNFIANFTGVLLLVAAEEIFETMVFDCPKCSYRLVYGILYYMCPAFILFVLGVYLIGMMDDAIYTELCSEKAMKTLGKCCIFPIVWGILVTLDGSCIDCMTEKCSDDKTHPSEEKTIAQIVGMVLTIVAMILVLVYNCHANHGRDFEDLIQEEVRSAIRLEKTKEEKAVRAIREIFFGENAINELDVAALVREDFENNREYGRYYNLANQLNAVEQVGGDAQIHPQRDTDAPQASGVERVPLGEITGTESSNSQNV
ncbi:uncharacterized protein [Ptychodera flava]|uniref:uncharacterized protein n=1 Tax=Ptychodera flava TaxID=63121 RepID=UPI00396A1EC9